MLFGSFYEFIPDFSLISYTLVMLYCEGWVNIMCLLEFEERCLSCKLNETQLKIEISMSIEQTLTHDITLPSFS